MTSYIELTSLFLISFITLFVIGLFGLILNRSNILKTIMALEILLLSINLLLVLYSVYLDDIIGQVFVLFILALSATESAIGLSILVLYYNKRGNINIDLIKQRHINFKNL